MEREQKQMDIISKQTDWCEAVQTQLEHSDWWEQEMVPRLPADLEAQVKHTMSPCKSVPKLNVYRKMGATLGIYPLCGIVNVRH